MARKGINNKVERPADVLFQKTEEKEELIRATYYLNDELQECIRIMAFKDNKQKSVLVRELLYESIPDEIIEKARLNLKEE